MNSLARRLCVSALLFSAIPAGAAPEAIPALGSPGPLASALQTLVDHHVVSGIVALVADKDGVRDLEAVGEASVAKKTPMRTDAVFWIASMTKSLTGAALMMLVDEGKVKLDDPVEKYLPEFKGQMVAEDKAHPHPPQHPITVREVMDHTSGVVTPRDPAIKNPKTLKETVEQIAAAPLYREPGTKFEYNNSGINTGGRIIEVQSGMPYDEFMRKRLFEPLGMTETTFWPNEALAARLVSTTKMTDDKTALEDIEFNKTPNPALIARLRNGVVVPEPMLENFGLGIIPDYANHYAMPAGGLYSTASDVGKFCRMLLNGGTMDGHKYLSEAALHEMSSIQTGDVMVNPPEGYGVGWFVKKKDDSGLSAGSFGHRGARKTVMWVDPKDQLTIVLMLQRMDMTGDQQKELDTTFRAAVEKFGKAH